MDFYLDPVRHTGRPQDARREPEELACYDLLDGLSLTYDRVDHDPAYHIETCHQVEAVLGRETVTGLAYRELPGGCRRELPCAGVFVAAGRKPNTELLQGQLELDAGGYVPADETTRTAVPGVFAAGDIRHKPMRQVVTAAADGAVAAGSCEAYLRRGKVKFFTGS